MLLTALPANAEDSIPVQLGTTGLYLPNHALSQDKHYLKQDDDLMGRIACLLSDMDSLLTELHALPPERTGSPETKPPTAEELPLLIALALEHNPKLEPLRSQLAVAGAKARQAGAKPDPMVMLGVSGLPLPQADLGDIPMTMIGFGWSQKYISYGKRGLRRSIAGLDANITELELSSEELELIDSICMQYFDLLATSTRLDAQLQNIELLKLLLALAERKYALGLTPQGQVITAQAKLTEMEQQQYKLEQQLARQQEALFGMLGRPSDFDPASLSLRADYTIPLAVALDQAALLAEMLSRRPDIQSFAIKQQQQAMRVDLAAREYRPDYTVSAEYGARWGKRDLFRINLAVPVFTHKADRQDAQVQEQAARADMLQQQQAALENELATQLGLMQIDLDRITELSARYRTALVPQARLALDSLIAGYAANQTSLDAVLSAQDDLLSYELELQQLSIEYLATLTQLQIATAGAFDPTPYLDSDSAAGEISSAIPATLPDSVAVQVAGEEQAQLNSLFLAPPSQQTNSLDYNNTSTGHTPPPIAGKLIESLELPQVQSSETQQLALVAAKQAQGVRQHAARVLQHGVVEPAGDRLLSQAEPNITSSLAIEGPDDFYTPFSPVATATEETHD